jgi:hypothetical protein
VYVTEPEGEEEDNREEATQITMVNIVQHNTIVMMVQPEAMIEEEDFTADQRLAITADQRWDQVDERYELGYELDEEQVERGQMEEEEPPDQNIVMASRDMDLANPGMFYADQEDRRYGNGFEAEAEAGAEAEDEDHRIEEVEVRLAQLREIQEWWERNRQTRQEEEGERMETPAIEIETAREEEGEESGSNRIEGEVEEVHVEVREIVTQPDTAETYWENGLMEETGTEETTTETETETEMESDETSSQTRNTGVVAETNQVQIEDEESNEIEIEEEIMQIVRRDMQVEQEVRREEGEEEERRTEHEAEAGREAEHEAEAEEEEMRREDRREEVPERGREEEFIEIMTQQDVKEVKRRLLEFRRNANFVQMNYTLDDGIAKLMAYGRIDNIFVDEIKCPFEECGNVKLKALPNLATHLKSKHGVSAERSIDLMRYYITEMMGKDVRIILKDRQGRRRKIQWKMVRCHYPGCPFIHRTTKHVGDHRKQHECLKKDAEELG